MTTRLAKQIDMSKYEEATKFFEVKNPRYYKENTVKDFWKRQGPINKFLIVFFFLLAIMVLVKLL